MAITFYFLFWTAVFAMIVWTFANASGAMPFSWLVVFACAAFFSYGTTWLDKGSG